MGAPPGGRLSTLRGRRDRTIPPASAPRVLKPPLSSRRDPSALRGGIGRGSGRAPCLGSGHVTASPRASLTPGFSRGTHRGRPTPPPGFSRGHSRAPDYAAEAGDCLSRARSGRGAPRLKPGVSESRGRRDPSAPRVLKPPLSSRRPRPRYEGDRAGEWVCAMLGGDARSRLPHA